MKAMRLEKPSDLRHEPQPLVLRELPIPKPAPGEILIEVGACAVCHTELDEIEGRASPAALPVIPGHQVIGRVVGHGRGAGALPIGTRVGAAWIFSACGQCPSCLAGLENLCADFRATGRDANGGYAEYMTLPEAFAHPIPAALALSDAEAAPLLCAGAVGSRSLNLTGLQDGQALGLTGFGASAHLVLRLVQHLFPQARVHVFARSRSEQEFARQLGAAWAGDTQEAPPELLDAVIDTTPVWQPLLSALKILKPGGRLVINAIRKENSDQTALLSLDYPAHLWMEKEIKSVANVTRQDVRDFLSLAANIPLRPEIQKYELHDANLALLELKQRKIRGAKVLCIQGGRPT
jgi:propanol-preferring alcohol dehydrogenase